MANDRGNWQGKWLLIFIAMLAFFCLVGATGACAHSGGRVNVPWTREAIRVDGILSEAAWLKAGVLRIDEFRIPGWLNSGSFVIEGPTPDQVGDVAAEVRFLRDSSHLYIALQVDDNDVVVDSIPGVLRLQDCVEFIFDPAHNNTQRLPLFFAPQTRSGAGPWFSLPGAVIAAAQRRGGQVGDIRELGYVAEIVIPLERMQQIYPEFGTTGQLMGLDVVINDVDEKEGRRVRKRLAWSGQDAADWKLQPCYGDLMWEVMPAGDGVLPEKAITEEIPVPLQKKPAGQELSPSVE